MDIVVLDKTGTLTMGRMSLVEVRLAEGEQRGELLAKAGALEAASEHLIAAALTSAATEELGARWPRSPSSRHCQGWAQGERSTVSRLRSAGPGCWSSWA